MRYNSQQKETPTPKNGGINFIDFGSEKPLPSYCQSEHECDLAKNKN